MPRKTVNGNIIGARWQDIRLCGEIIAVNRRTGGLEIEGNLAEQDQRVNRRTGGLERIPIPKFVKGEVNRRTGGLEIYPRYL